MKCLYPVVLLFLLVFVQDAVAQGKSATAGNMHKAAQGMDCAALTSMPHAPMTRQACETLKASGLQLSGEMAQTGSGQPGDDAMTCDQIAAEMQTMEVAGVSAEHAAEAQAAGEQLQRSQRQAQAAATAMSARHAAGTAAAAGAPNAVGGAVALAQSAEQQALAKRSGALAKTAQSRTTLAIASANEDLAASMRDNPRWARLLIIASTRCSHHPVFNGSSIP